MPKSFIGQHFWTRSVWLSQIIAWKVTNIEQCCKRRKCTSIFQVSGNMQRVPEKEATLIFDITSPSFEIFFTTFEPFYSGIILLAGASSNRSGVVEIDISPFSRCYIFVSFTNNAGINCTLRWHPVVDFCRHHWMTLNDLECPIRLTAYEVCMNFRRRLLQRGDEPE